MADAARVYAEALFEVGRDKGKLDTLQQQLGEFTDAVDRNRELQVFFFSPYLSSEEKVEGLKRAISGAEPELINFLELLVDKHRMPEIFRIRRDFEELWKRENRRIDVTVTSAVELDSAVVEKIGQEVERQTGEKVDLSSSVDSDILGGIVLQVGNMVLDASIRSRLEKLRKSVATAAH
jgi:ATP synthase F1 delta subunit